MFPFVVKGKILPRAARREDHGATEEQPNRATADVERRDPAHRTPLDHELRDELLVVADDPVEAHGVLEEGVEHVEADLVRGEPGALRAHAPEGARRHAAVFVAAPGTAPVLEQGQLHGACSNEVLDDVLVAEEVRALHRVVGVHLEVVVVAGDGGGTPSAETVWLRMG